MASVLDGRADAVIGTRFRGETVRVLYYWHSLGNHLLTLFSNMLTNLNVSDMEVCYKLIRTDLAKSLPLVSERFGIEPELIARLSQARAGIYEVPIGYSGGTYADGRKIGWRDGIAACWHIVRFNLLPPRAALYSPSKEPDAWRRLTVTSGRATARLSGSRSSSPSAVSCRSSSGGIWCRRTSSRGRRSPAPFPVLERACRASRCASRARSPTSSRRLHPEARARGRKGQSSIEDRLRVLIRSSARTRREQNSDTLHPRATKQADQL